MSFMYDRKVKFFVGLISVIILLFAAADIWLAVQQSRDAAVASAEHDAAVASSLIKNGVSAQTVASALVNKEVTEGGREIVGKLGPVQLSLPNAAVLTAAVLILLAVLLFSAMFFFLAGREKLYKEAMETVSEYAEGDFSRRLPVSNDGTLYKLLGSIENMAAALKSKQENEKRTKEFLKNTISDIFHQLKTPLAAFSMYNEIIAAEPENAAVTAEFAAKSERSVNRMKTLISELLKVVRLDFGSTRFNIKSYAVRDVAEQGVEELKTRAEREGKTIILSGSDKAQINCDFSWTAEAVGNIVKNALNHTGRGGVVNITWEITPLMVRIYISDNGCGISADDIHHIFKRFYKSKNSIDKDGIGLGLPLVKAIIEGQEGTVSVTSEEGRGTVFVLSFLTKV